MPYFSYHSIFVVFELSVDDFLGGGGGGARPDLWPDADANAEANVTFDDVGVDAKMGNVGWTP